MQVGQSHILNLHQETRRLETMKLFSKAGIVSLLILIGLLLLLFSGELVLSLVQAAQNSPVGVKRQPPVTPVGSRLLTPIIPLSPEVSATATSPITVLNHQDAPPLQLANEQYVIYMQRDMLYLVSIVGNYAQVIPTERSEERRVGKECRAGWVLSH